MKKNKEGSATIAQVKMLVENTAPKVQELTYGEGENAFIVKVYPVIPFKKRMEMVKEIVSGVFMDERDSIECYAPECLEFLQRFTVLKYFTNMTIPSKLEDAWLVIKYTPIYEDVMKIVYYSAQAIFEAANNEINTIRQHLASKTDFNRLMLRVGDSLSKISDKLPKEQMEIIINRLKNIPEGSDIKSIIGGLLGK